ncbi:MAG: hypothetical protein HYV47_02700 [Candidatus Nealsonbacteria bacterium]|nr:hypothetical protein [Candidatus Nealsonbacteria bacterium]
MLEIIRWSAFSSTILMAGFGYSDQLRLILQNKTTAGLSLAMVVLSFAVWTSYALYGFLKKDYKIFWSNFIGVIFIAFILLAFLIY